MQSNHYCAPIPCEQVFRTLRREEIMVTIKDVAKRCNVSVSTVSKALNQRHDVSKETRAIVIRTAEKMKYSPNTLARCLRTKHSYLLGIMFWESTRSGLTHEYFSRLLNSFKDSAEECGYDISFIYRNFGGKYVSYYDFCKLRGFDGVVATSVDYSDPCVLELINSDLPLVSIDHVFNNRISIVSDNIEGIRELVIYAYEKGHRKIAYIHGKKSTVTNNRLASFYRTCNELNISPPEHYLLEGSYHNIKASESLTRQLFALKDRPTCILYPDDYSAFGALSAIQEMGLSVPEDISVIGYDGMEIAQLMRPALTTYWQDTNALGSLAAKCLVDLIDRPKATVIRSYQTQGRLLKGNTVKDLTVYS